MLFSVTAEKMVMVDGKIITIKAGEFEATDKALIEHLNKLSGVGEIKAEPKSKATK